MSKKWKYDKLSNLCSRIGDGLHGTPEYCDNTAYFFVNGNNLRNGKIEITTSSS
jgi:type I restriction enzyme S subunit